MRTLTTTTASASVAVSSRTVIHGGHRTTVTVPTSAVVLPALAADLSATSDVTLPVVGSITDNQGVVEQLDLNNTMTSSIGDAPPMSPFMDDGAASVSQNLFTIIEGALPTDVDCKFFILTTKSVT